MRVTPGYAVLRFAAGATEAERYTDRVPVRRGDRTLGETDLARIFDRPR